MLCVYRCYTSSLDIAKRLLLFFHQSLSEIRQKCASDIHIYRVTHILIYKWMYFRRYFESKEDIRGLKEILNKIFWSQRFWYIIRAKNGSEDDYLK